MTESVHKRSRLTKAVDPHEVKLAGEVQRLLLPKNPPLCSWCCMAARNRMAEVLGGDFYDFIELDDGCQVLLIGDVTGHGLHASVVMSLIYGFIHNAARQSGNPSDVVADLNTDNRGDVAIAAITSCTNTSNPSVLLGAGLMAKKAVEHGLLVRPGFPRPQDLQRRILRHVRHDRRP